MSVVSAKSPVSPIQHRDIRSDSVHFKRDKDHRAKWEGGARPQAGIKINHWFTELPGESSEERFLAKVRPVTRGTNEKKSHANKNPKPFGHYDQARQAHKVSAIVDANDHTSSLSKSLLELLPTHANNTQSAIHTAVRESLDENILYSFDNKGPSPGLKGNRVDLGGLVELAEQKWVSEQTERMVRGEYEVLDIAGETMSTKKSKKSPKQRAHVEPAVPKIEAEEDDGFEMI